MGKSSESLVPRMERINLLMDIYGALLTDKQKRFVDLHFGEDLSFGEIASQYNVSRQAIYDAVKHALANLERYEKTLSLLPRHQNGDIAAAESMAETPEETSTEKLGDNIHAIHQLRVRIQKQNIVYNVDWIVHELTRIITSLEAVRKGKTGDSEGER